MDFNNHTLKKIMDEIAVENSQALIRKDLLLNLCDCGCGFEVGSEGFQNLHVENPEEEILQGMSYQEFCEETNPTYEQLAKLEQIRRRDY